MTCRRWRRGGRAGRRALADGWRGGRGCPAAAWTGARVGGRGGGRAAACLGSSRRGVPDGHSEYVQGGWIVEGRRRSAVELDADRVADVGQRDRCDLAFRLDRHGERVDLRVIRGRSAGQVALGDTEGGDVAWADHPVRHGEVVAGGGYRAAGRVGDRAAGGLAAGHVDVLLALEPAPAAGHPYA